PARLQPPDARPGWAGADVGVDPRVAGGEWNLARRRTDLMPLVLTILEVVTAALTIVSKARESKRGEYVFKPLTTVLILAIALLADNPISSTYRALIVAGLVASLAGDVFLMLPDRFTPGLLSFLIAHIFYILAFT